MTAIQNLVAETDIQDRFKGKTFRQVRREALEEGREEGREEGLLMAYRDAIQQLAQRKNIVLTEEGERRLEACCSVETLISWLTLVATTTESPLTLP